MRRRCRERPVSERRLTGRRASPGFAAGTVAVLAPAAAQRGGTGDPAAEAKTLAAALAAALAEVRALALKVTGDDADIIGLQIALMEDFALADPAYAAIAAGESADVAWAAALDAEIAGYESAADEYFRARASDLNDIRDRVLDQVAGSAVGAGPAPGEIVAARDLPPSRFLAIDWS